MIDNSSQYPSRLEALKARRAELLAGSKSGESTSSEGLRGAGIVGRGLSKGVGGFFDIGKEAITNPRINPAGAFGKMLLEKLSGNKLDTDYTQKGADLYDYLTNEQFKPDSLGEEILQTGAEYGVGAGGLNLVGKGLNAGSRLKKLITTKSPRDLLGLGGAAVGTEIAREKFPDTNIAPIVGAVVGGATPGAITGLTKGVINTPKALYNLPSKIIPSKRNKIEAGKINETLNQISPGYEGEVNEDIRKASQDIIGRKTKALQEKAKPFYEKAAPQKIQREELLELFYKYPIVKETLDNVLENKLYHPEIEKFGVNSIHTLDLTKKKLDAKINSLYKAVNPEQNSYEAKLYTEAKEALVDKLDKLSPDYKKARRIYSEDKPSIKKLQESKLGRFSKYTDEQVKKIGKEIFDPLETNPKRRHAIRDRLHKENPEMWDAITRQELERKIGSPTKGLEHFYDRALKDDKAFEALDDALIYNPTAQENIRNFRTAYMKTKGNPQALKAGLTSIDPIFTKTFRIGALVDFLFSPKWTGELKSAAENKTSLSDVLSKATKEGWFGSTKVGEKRESHYDKERASSEQQEAPKVSRLEALKRRKEQLLKKETNKERLKFKKPESPLIDKIAQVESGGNPNARSNTSSASGLLQFTNSTWKEGVNRYGEEEGVSLRDKNNPEAQRKIANRLLADNSKELEKFLGRKPKDAEIYMTHFLGLGGTKKLLKSNDKRVAAHIFPVEARANRNVFYKNGRPITIAELKSKINQMIS